jgi:membrane protein
MLKKVKTFFSINRDSFSLLRRTEPLVLSSSTAFFTTFSLSPILILLVSLFGLYFTSDRISNQVFGKLGSTIGYETAREIESIVNNFMEYETTGWLTIAGIIFFLFIATTLLAIIKQNIHKLWRIRRNRPMIRHKFRERMVLICIILITGALFLISLLIDSSLAISLDYLQTILPHAGIVFIKVVNFIFSLIVITLWFTIIFKILPDAKVEWDVAFTGAFLTAILFTGGKFLLGKVLVHARIASIFGASASFALLLLFIFYSSFILYYGAAFTHEYAEYVEKHICAGRHASEYEERLLNNSLPDS